MSLPIEKYKKRAVCVTFGYGQFNVHALQVTKIKILDDCYEENAFCIHQYRAEQRVDSCNEYTGGQPIFCKGAFVSMINHYYHLGKCNSSRPRTATMIYDNLKWIQRSIRQLNSISVYTSRKSSANILEYKNFSILYVIFMSIKSFYS